MLKTKHDEFIQQVSEELGIDSYLVHDVVQHQFKAAKEGFYKQPSIELPRFFYMTLRPKRALKKLEMVISVLSPDYKKRLYNKDFVKEKLEYLVKLIMDYDKLYPGNFRRLKELGTTPRAFEELSKRGFEPQEADLQDLP